MKIGFCMLLWTTHVTEKHRPILEALKATGYDGVEVPVFEGTPDHYARVGRMLDELDLGRTAITVVPTEDKNPIGKDAAQRKAAVDYLKYCVDCTAELGATCIGGPLTQTLGHFSGKAPTDAERSRARSVHRKVGDYAERQGVQLAIEAVNRFESYFVNTMHDLAAYLDFVDHPAIQGMYDTFHANLEEVRPDRRDRRDPAAHDPRPHLRERPRRARARARAVGRDLQGVEEIRLRRLADDRGVRARPA